MKLYHKYLILFLLGGSIYMLIEILWRGHTHWTMGILGGVCFICCGLLNQIFSWKTPLWLQMLMSSLIITFFELIAGVILNLWLGLNIWDYSKIFMNLAGQICLPYTVLWFFLSAFAIIFDDYIRYYFFGEDKPTYCIW